MWESPHIEHECAGGLTFLAETEKARRWAAPKIARAGIIVMAVKVPGMCEGQRQQEWKEWCVEARGWPRITGEDGMDERIFARSNCFQFELWMKSTDT